MEYNSLEAQRDAGLAYIASQRHEGWIAVADGYDDGGFSGGNMERPALRRLMDDIEDGKIDIVVVYKIDRSEEHTSELQSLMRNSYAVFCLKHKNNDICQLIQKKTHQ